MKKLFATSFAFLISGLLFCTTALAQIQYEQDWAFFKRYASENAQIEHQPLAVFMGDSITDHWDEMHLPFFKDNNILCRGISGQTTSQMLVRFRRDVIELHPKYVLIMAGTNDIAHNTGYIALDNIVGNICSMCELAKTHHIKPIILSITPSKGYPWRPKVQNVAQSIVKVNTLLQHYAKKNHIPYLDLHSMLQDEEGGLPECYSPDGVHPNLQCYLKLEPVILKALKVRK